MKIKKIKRANNQRLKRAKFKHLRLDYLRAELSRARIKLDKTNAACKRIQYDYRIEPRSTELGGGFRLYLFENGIDVGGGVYADENYEYCYDDALHDAEDWCNSSLEYRARDDAIHWFGFAEYRLNEAINRQNSMKKPPQLNFV